jgi:hypothetical protein
MHCPRCGTEAAGKPKFCRVCGQDLVTVSAVLSGQLVIDLWKRGSMIWGTALMIGGAALGSVLKVLTNQGINPAGEITPYLLALAVLIFFAGFGLILFSAVSVMFPHRQSAHPSAESANTARMKPELLSEEMAGITERTTALFEGEEPQVSVRTTAPQDE